MDEKKYLEVLSHQIDFEEFCKQKKKHVYSERHSRTNDKLMPIKKLFN